MKKVSKTVTDVCKELGSNYEIKEIDLEDCIYRNLNNGFDFEISGTKKRLGNISCTLYIWKTEPSTEIVEIVEFKKVGITRLKNELEKQARKYLDPNVIIPDSKERRTVITG